MLVCTPATPSDFGTRCCPDQASWSFVLTLIARAKYPHSYVAQVPPPPTLRFFRVLKVSGTPPAAAVSAESDQYWVWAEMMRRAGCKVDHGAEQVRATSCLLFRDAREESSMWRWTRDHTKIHRHCRPFADGEHPSFSRTVLVVCGTHSQLSCGALAMLPFISSGLGWRQGGPRSADRFQPGLRGFLHRASGAVFHTVGSVGIRYVDSRGDWWW